MKTTLKTLIIALLLFNSTVHAANIQKLVVYFDKDKWELKAEERSKLSVLKSADFILMQGHTDNDGGDQYNAQLSQKRVKEVRTAVNSLCPTTRIETGYFGEGKPTNSNNDELEKTANRRVEISYISGDPLLRTRVQTQYREIDNSKDQVLTLNEGTKVEIPAGAFGNQHVLIKASEYYNPLQIFSANLGTQSDGRMIETAGMIYIEAEVKGVKVEPSKPLTYKFPRKNQNADFRFFEGKRNSDFSLNWTTPTIKNTASEAAVDSTATGTIEQNVNLNYGGAWFFPTFTGDMRSLDKWWFEFIKIYTAKNWDTADLTAVPPLDCMMNDNVTLSINRDGRITDVTTSKTDVNNECDRALKKFVALIFPKRFAPLNADSKITLKFQAYTNAIRTFGGGFSKLDETAIAKLSPEARAKYEAEYIILSSSQLGWINCDRFMNAQSVIAFNAVTDTNAVVRMAFKKYKAFFPGIYGNGSIENKEVRNFTFFNVPPKEDVVLISTKTQDGKIFLAIEETQISNQPFSKFNYKEVTQKELEQAVKNLKL